MVFEPLDALGFAGIDLANLEFVAFDIETTGLYAETDRITEIGALRFSTSGTIDEFEELVDPRRPISAEASRVSGITQIMVKGKPAIGDILPRFLQFIGNSLLIAHNAKFDCSFIAVAICSLGLKMFSNPVLDTRLLAKSLWKNLAGYSLSSVINALSLPHSRFHRALRDAAACRDVFLTALEKLNRAYPLSFFLEKRIIFRMR